MSVTTRTSIPRKAKKLVTYTISDSWFPDHEPQDAVQLRISTLNSESFCCSLYSLADDMVTRALFGSTKKLRWNSVTPESSSHARALLSSSVQDDLKRAALICGFLTNTQIQGSLQHAVCSVTKSLMSLSCFNRQEKDWEAILHQ